MISNSAMNQTQEPGFLQLRTVGERALDALESRGDLVKRRVRLLNELPNLFCHLPSSYHQLARTTPPSTGSVTPVMYPARSDARKATAAANSSGVPSLPSGTSRAN